jgi:hypothetical protein
VGTANAFRFFDRLPARGPAGGEGRKLHNPLIVVCDASQEAVSNIALRRTRRNQSSAKTRSGTERSTSRVDEFVTRAAVSVPRIAAGRQFA